MPNGAEYIASGQVIVEKVHRTHAGEYQCVVNTTKEIFRKDIMVNVLCK